MEKNPPVGYPKKMGLEDDVFPLEIASLI